MTLVMKFGGTSVGNAPAMRETAGLILRAREEWGQVVVVLSAMGSSPVKVTDLLLKGAKAAASGDDSTYQQVTDELRQIHYLAVDALLMPEGERQQALAENGQFITRFSDLCQAVLLLGELTPRALDAISGMGEQMSVRILAAYLRQLGYEAQGIDATDLIVTDESFQSASPLLEPTRAQTKSRLSPLLDRGVIPIVTGFIGATINGVITTLGRGGSDFSAAILGQALGADEVWIWTDVDGVMTADPRLVPVARSIERLTYREISELAYYGARVLHPKTIRPCLEDGIPLRIKNSFNPTHPGTVVVPDDANGNGGIKAVTSIENLSLVTVEGKGMVGVPGIAARTFGAVAREQVNVLLISQASSEQSICFATTADVSEHVTASLESEFVAELGKRDIDRIWAQAGVSIVTIVGAGMRGTPGIAGRIFSALGKHQVNIIAIAQGSSECSISLVVDEHNTAAAVTHVHTLIAH
jgi:aspartate kinase